MPQLKTFQLRDFRRVTSAIPDIDEKKDPMLAYILLRKSGELVKIGTEITACMKVDLLLPQGNLFKVVPQDIMADDLLINERLLYAIVDKTKSESISIEIEKNENADNPDTVIINDGRSYVEFQKVDPNLFPELPEMDGKVGKIIDSTMIAAMKVAKSFVDDSADLGYLRTVHMHKNCIVGMNTFCIYIKEFDKQFTSVSISSKQVDILSQFETLTFYDSDNHSFFALPSGELTYSFKKQEIQVPLFEIVVENIKKQMENGAKHFLMEKDDLVEFLDVVDKVAKTAIRPMTFMKSEKDGDILYLNDNAYNKGVKRKIAIAGELAEFTFNAFYVAKAFKALPQHRLDCYVAQNNLIVKEQDNSLACFSGFQKLVNE